MEATNCTFLDNYGNLEFDGGTIQVVDGSWVYLSHCIFAESVGKALTFEDIPDLQIAYCDFYDNDGIWAWYSNRPDGFEELLTTNRNGEPCDTFYNIFSDPLIGGGYQLDINSPCINAGDSTLGSVFQPTRWV